MSGIKVDEIGTTLENALYTAVGLGILAFQHLQVQRRAVERHLGATVRQVAEALERNLADR
ncbi:MAG: hypothetical protein C0P77_000895 [Thermoanaerobacterales bacterium]|jgi:hypothetical protein|nr:hypothetical protein [Thermoanaerobacterales bacterium]